MHSIGWAQARRMVQPNANSGGLPTCWRALTCGGVELCGVSNALVGVGAERSVHALGGEGCRGAEQGTGIRTAPTFLLRHPQELQLASKLGC